MQSSTGRWVSGNDFFDRESEIQILETRVRNGNHTLLTGQRRMGKTSIARELGQRLEADGWVFLFTDVEGATDPEDAVAGIAQAVFAPDARRHLGRMYSTMVDDAAGRIADALDVLVHDGYLDAGDGGYRFLSNLLKDWWSARFHDHHRPLVESESRTAQ